ncbi:50S ribosomal protein L2 [Brachyspira aalborgi]|jgi:ribosomal protein L2|uniref:Large ribosomal subunit protein uL2 n=1 Tax=Brachyspira aalborgi TaxID=29522 RepID=A0A5C8CEZ3_9SPIR|nr:50S ribosomal protein L2 [Brachyspira aalborgi]TXJ12044.1 50S ribosomal protein L2 [Brachyspira aalborgi]
MAIKKFKPTTPSLRYRTVVDFSDITTNEPCKSLVYGKKRISGRSSNGRITMRRRGGGHKKLFRLIDFRRDKHDIEAKVVSVEYDPNRSAYISLLNYTDGEKRYIIYPLGLNIGDKVISGENAKVRVGCSLPLRKIPLGTIIHNIELTPGKGGQLVRAAGGGAQITAKSGGYCVIRLRSGEERRILENCYATIGQIGNLDHFNTTDGKAGTTRHKGRRPKVRGVVMNPVDHPHGGGEGKSGQGNPHPVSPTGVPTKGYKTRKKNKYSDRLIIKKRGGKK